MDKNKGLVLCSLESTNTSEQVRARLRTFAVPRGVQMGPVGAGGRIAAQVAGGRACTRGQHAQSANSRVEPAWTSCRGVAHICVMCM